MPDAMNHSFLNQFRFEHIESKREGKCALAEHEHSHIQSETAFWDSSACLLLLFVFIEARFGIN